MDATARARTAVPGAARPAMLPDLVALMELRLTLDTEIAALAARHRDRRDLLRLKGALAAFARELEADGDDGPVGAAATRRAAPRVPRRGRR